MIEELLNEISNEYPELPSKLFILARKIYSNDNRTKEELKKILGRLNKKVHSIKFRSDDGTVFQTSISIGCGRIHSEDEKITDVITHIDDALYLSKRTKNTFTII